MHQHDLWPCVHSHDRNGVELSDQSAGTHSSSRTVVLHLEDQCADGTQDGGGEGGRYPDQGILPNIGDLEHAGANSLAQQPPQLVLFIGTYRESYHLATAPYHRGSRGETTEAQADADRRAADR